MTTMQTTARLTTGQNRAAQALSILFVMAALAAGAIVGVLMNNTPSKAAATVGEQPASIRTIERSTDRAAQQPASLATDVTPTAADAPAAVTQDTPAVAPAAGVLGSTVTQQGTGQAPHVTASTPAVSQPSNIDTTSDPAPIVIAVPHTPSTPSGPIAGGPTADQIADQVAREMQRQAEQNYNPTQNQAG